MTPNEYQRLALRTEKTPTFISIPGKTEEENHKISRILHALIGVCTEVGESQDPLKKLLVYGKEIDDLNLVEELGDKLWYIALGCDALGVTMEECMFKNIAKLEKRYGGAFSQEKALNRDLAGERVALESEEKREE